MHYILESTFARIFLFLELPLLQGVSIYRENLFSLTSAKQRSKKMAAKGGERVASVPSLAFLFSLVLRSIFTTERTWFELNKVNTSLERTRAVECEIIALGTANLLEARFSHLCVVCSVCSFLVFVSN